MRKHLTSPTLHSNDSDIMLQNPTKREELEPMQPHKHVSGITVYSTISVI